MIFIAQHAERCPSHSLLATKQKHSEKDTSCNVNYGFIMIIIKLICGMCSYFTPLPRPFLTRAFEVIQSGSTFTLQIVWILSAQPGASPSKQPDAKTWRLRCSLKTEGSRSSYLPWQARSNCMDDLESSTAPTRPIAWIFLHKVTSYPTYASQLSQQWLFKKAIHD